MISDNGPDEIEAVLLQDVQSNAQVLKKGDSILIMLGFWTLVNYFAILIPAATV